MLVYIVGTWTTMLCTYGCVVEGIMCLNKHASWSYGNTMALRVAEEGGQAEASSHVRAALPRV